MKQLLGSFMLKKISKYLPQIIAFLFLAGFAVYAWTEPPNIPGAPPAGNVEGPVNVGSAGQTKSGWLAILQSIFVGGAPSASEKSAAEAPGALGMLRTVGGAIFNTGGAATGLIVSQGNVGIGTASPVAKLDVQGGDVKVGTVEIKGDGSISANLNADKLDNQHASELRPPTGLYGYCQQWVGGLVLPPAFQNPGPPISCECSAGYQKVITDQGSNSPVFYQIFSCYKQ